MSETLANILTQQAGEPKVPEGIEVVIVSPQGMTVTEQMARTVAPHIAERVHPGRALGGVIHAEHCEVEHSAGQAEHWHCVVEDYGPDYGQIMGRIKEALA
jgi:hypothetical protein